MGNRKTEEEMIERVIRGLLKLPENRRCINCNLLGPQYVCTTFFTFVCTNCSGIHREFTHRIKSVSMAKFTPEEVTALQAGGNERAKQLYFKEWDPLRHSYPDSCNIHRLRDFIKQVYVERRFTGENCSSSLPKLRLTEKEESYANKKSSSFRFELRSPQSSPGPRSDDKNLRYLYDESRSPKYTQKYSRHGGHVRSPIQIEVVDDRFRDDDRRNRRQSNIESKLKQISIDGPKNVDKSQFPIIRPLGEVLKEKAPSLQVKNSGGEGSVKEKPSEKKKNNPESSRDLSTKSEATHSASGGGPESPSITQTQSPSITQTQSPSITQSNENNWAIFGASTENNDSTTPNTKTSNPSTTKATSEAAVPAKSPLDLLLLELSGPVTPVTQAPSGANNDPSNTTVENANTWDIQHTSVGQTTASSNNSSVWSFTSTPATELAKPYNEVPPKIEVSHAHKSSSMQYLPSVSQPSNEVPPKTEVSHAHKPSSMQYLPSVSQPSNEVPPKTEVSHARKPSSMQYLPSVSQPSNEVPPKTEVSHAHKPSSMQYLPSVSQPSNEVPPKNDVSHAQKPSSMQNFPFVSQPSNEVPPKTEVSHAHKPSSMQNFPFVSQPSNEVPPKTEVSHGHKPSSMQYLPPVSTVCSSTTQPINSPAKDIASNNQPSVAPNRNDSFYAFTELSSQTQTTSKLTQETRPNVGSQLNKVETRSSGRQELPQDLFTSSYLSAGPAQLAGWQNVQPQGMGYGMQYYHNAGPLSALPNVPTPKTANPFELSDGRSLIHASSLPAMASFNVVPPSGSPRTGLCHASSLDSLGMTMASQSPFYVSPVPMGGYFGQVNNKEQPTRSDSFNNELDAFGSLDLIQQSNRGYMDPKPTIFFSNTRGNPFD